MRQTASLTNWDSWKPEDVDVSWELVRIESSNSYRNSLHLTATEHTLWDRRGLTENCGRASGIGIKPGPGTVQQVQDLRNIDVF
ncbi:unnamed protein product [Echinostoma caproni]|uniref:HNH endonuclease n=1 Tax=Echinostoma caproni TaxID=27848 RepID=A0A183B7L9_9TREM|nr:unnamed protein product [Echinostoma caproni]